MSRYKYTPLDSQSQQIRLMSLASGMFDDNIYVSLRTVALTQDNPPEYEALSYTWGSTENRPDVSVVPDIGTDGIWKPLAALNMELSGRLAVTQNLAQALRYLRQPAQPRTLWIDAICINQEDVKERGQQVERMGDVYRSARQVLVWLGPNSHDSALAIETLNSLGRSIEVDWDTISIQPKDFADTDLTMWNVPLPYDENTWRSINNFLRRSWFKRLWIWQEVLLARKAGMHCGCDNIDWHTFCQAIFCIASKLEQNWQVWKRLGLTDLPMRMQGLPRLARPFSRNIAISERLDMLETRECLDPRDKMNALLHLLAPSDRAVMPKPDYTQSAYLIFQKVILGFMKYRGELDLLTFCEWDGESLRKPSWVPDWSRPRTVSRLLDPRAGLGSQAKALYMGEGLLKVMGKRTAEISVVNRRTLQNDEDPRLDPTPIQVARWIRTVSIDFDINLPYITGGSTIDAFSCTLFQYFAETFEPAVSFLPSENECLQFVRDVLRDLFEEIETGSFMPSRLFATMNGRLLFISKEGHIGLVPDVAVEGDMVCVILGCDSPLLLRPLPNGNYRVIGECYIHGLMNGEALLGPLPNGWKPVRILEEELGYVDGFHNMDTGEHSFVDPRLGSLPPGWSLEDPQRRAGWSNWFVNYETGDEMDWPQDPRMTAEALEAQGVSLQDFILE